MNIVENEPSPRIHPQYLRETLRFSSGAGGGCIDRFVNPFIEQIAGGIADSEGVKPEISISPSNAMSPQTRYRSW